MTWQIALQWLLEHGHDVVYQTRENGVRGHFLTVLYLPSPVSSTHRSHMVEGEDFEDCVIAARDWVAANAEHWDDATDEAGQCPECGGSHPGEECLHVYLKRTEPAATAPLPHPSLRYAWRETDGFVKNTGARVAEQLCPRCHGDGQDIDRGPTADCRRCGGTGTVVEKPFPYRLSCKVCGKDETGQHGASCAIDGYVQYAPIATHA